MPEFEAASARACEYLLAKHAPFWMSIGELHEAEGTERAAKTKQKPPTAVTALMVSKMIQLAGPPAFMGPTDIAFEMHVAPSTVIRNLKKHGAHIPQRSRWGEKRELQKLGTYQ